MVLFGKIFTLVTQMSTKSNYNLFPQSYPFTQEGGLYLAYNYIIFYNTSGTQMCFTALANDLIMNLATKMLWRCRSGRIALQRAEQKLKGKFSYSKAETDHLMMRTLLV